MTKWCALIVTCLALGLVAVGCGDDDEDEGGGGADTTEQPTATTGEPPAAAKASATVTLKDIAFEPADVTVKTGGKVEWVHDDSVNHDVTKEGGPGADFKSGDPGGMKKGDSYEQTFKEAGKVEYQCTVHPQMTGTVTVK